MTKVRENHETKTAGSPIKTSSSQLAGNYWSPTGKSPNGANKWIQATPHLDERHKLPRKRIE